MKKKDNEETFENKLDKFIENHIGEIDSKLYASMIKSHISDVLFDEHINTKSKINFVMILIQFFVVIIGLILSLFGSTLFSCIASNVVIFILIVVLINNHISSKEWKRALKRLETTYKMIDRLEEKCEEKDVNEIL